ncbi:MAG: tetratricopeptide repeat protein [Saprospiraceae bacterium]|nr:tetratricopeptide repeat protein [Saprospiraceae bacterium]
MRVCLVFTLLFLVRAECSPQSIDSLRHLWLSSDADLPQEFDVLQSLMNEFQSSYQLDSATRYGLLRLALSKETQDFDRQLESHLDLGIINYRNSQYDSALYHLQKALSVSEQIGETTWLSNIYRMTGVVLEAQGHPDQSLEYYQQSLDLGKENNDSVSMAMALNSLAIAHQFYLSDLDKAIGYYQEAIGINKELGQAQSLGNNYYNLAVAYYNSGNSVLAIENLLLALTQFETLKDTVSIQDCYNVIGNIYDLQDDHEKALEYYQQSLQYSERTGDKVSEAAVRLNIGNLYLEDRKYEEADTFLRIGVDILENAGNLQYLPGGYHNLGILEMEYGSLPNARMHLNKSIQLAMEINDEPNLAKATAAMGTVEARAGRYTLSLNHLNNAITIAEKVGDLESLRSIYQELTDIYRQLGNTGKELESYRSYILYHDSLLNERSIRETTRQELQFNFAKQQLADSLAFAHERMMQNIALQKVRENRNLILGILIALMLVAGLIFYLYKQTQRARKRSDELLLNILPSETADELKSKGYTTAKTFDQVTILFTDFKDFTQLAEQLSASDLVKEIDRYFTTFDEIIEKFGLEKIKTNGDSYIAAGGLPERNKAVAKDVVEAALEMQEFVTQMAEKKEAENNPFFQMRIGLHSGPVIAGVVGIKKFQYDIWGDTVNTASRMETSGEVGRVNISDATYSLISQEPAFRFERRGKVSAKHKGEVEMFFVDKA